MFIKELNLKNFRNYTNLNIEFSPDINFIIGENGTGKTNILESISIISGLKSFRNINDSEIIKWGQESYFCSSIVEACNYNKFEIGCTFISNKLKKKVKIDGAEIKSVSNYYGKLLSVVFSPIDINLINGSPDLRRRFFDSVISKIDMKYLETLNEFKKILASRNKLLKKLRDNNITDFSQLEVWDQLFAQKSSEIIYTRKLFIDKFNKIFKNSYLNISAEEDTPDIIYSSSIEIDDSENIFNNLLKLRKRDIIIGSTRIGPQRDDYIIMKNDKTHFINYASQGQRRTAAISLKISECEIIEEEKNEKSIILVDDIFSELDLKRRKNMVEILRRGNQIIFTMVNSNTDYLDSLGDHKSFFVESGGVVK